MRTATVIKALLLASALLLSDADARSEGCRARWRAATPEELRQVIPARVPVVKEKIEAEFRTAAGATDGCGRFIAGVAIITAGYSADGQYSHFFITQAPLKVGNTDLRPGQYVFGYKRVDDDTIHLSFYRASSGEPAGGADARRSAKGHLVSSLLITPPEGGKASLQIGRFLLEFRVAD